VDASEQPNGHTLWTLVLLAKERHEYIVTLKVATDSGGFDDAANG
jgi:hypothetical protein